MHIFVANKTKICALDQWLSEPTNASKLIDLIKVDDKRITDWITATGFDARTHLPGVMAKGWITNWSVDMSVLVNDTNLRNTVSYRPQHYNLTHPRTYEQIIDRIDFIDKMWELCNPSALFDLTLWRLSLEYLYSQLFSYNIAQLDRVKDLEPIFTALGKDPHSRISIGLMDFLERKISASDNILFAKATQNPNPIREQTIEPLGIISRACLMANFATSAAQDLLNSTRTSRSDIEFWLESFGVKSGFWPAGSPPALMSDLWIDVSLELEELSLWKGRTAQTGSHTDPSRYRNEMHNAVFTTKQFNRSHLWNLGV